jgi:hypothetical protein
MVKTWLLGVLALILAGTVMVGPAAAQNGMGTIYVWNLWQNQSGDPVTVYLQLSSFKNPSWCTVKYLGRCSFSAPAGSHHLKAVDATHKVTIAETEASVRAGSWFKWCVYGNNTAQAPRCDAWLKSNNPNP